MNSRIETDGRGLGGFTVIVPEPLPALLAGPGRAVASHPHGGKPHSPSSEIGGAPLPLLPSRPPSRAALFLPPAEPDGPCPQRPA